MKLVMKQSINPTCSFIAHLLLTQVTELDLLWCLQLKRDFSQHS